eukprot:1160990-Pelagomonas_calceolata.AAC.11
MVLRALPCMLLPRLPPILCWDGAPCLFQGAPCIAHTHTCHQPTNDRRGGGGGKLQQQLRRGHDTRCVSFMLRGGGAHAAISGGVANAGR